jgi:hypothetical protein
MLGMVVLVVVTACGGDGSSSGGGGSGAYAAFSCTAGFRMADGGAGPPAVCAEASSGTPAQIDSNRAKCLSEGSAFALSACSRQGLAGGCRVSQGGESVTTWYYLDQNTTTDSVKQVCAGLSGVAQGAVTVEFVPP